MAKRSKRWKALSKVTEELGRVDINTAVKTLKGLESGLPSTIKPCNYDQSVELVMRLGVDPRQADQLVRGSIVLPNGIGKSQRIIVFAQGDNVALAEAAGAAEVGGKDLAEKIKGGWVDFDVAIATPDMMGVVGPLGRVLGPRGLMPSPRAGTVTQDVVKAVEEYKAGKVEFRCDSAGNVHCIVGKLSFDLEKLQENVDALISYIDSLKPSAAKGTYVRNVSISSTVSPAIAVAL